MTAEEAIAFAATEWWKKLSHQDITAFQLFEPRLCMPFALFQEAVEASLGRPVFTHEFGLNVEGLRDEFMEKKRVLI
jgi:hypothetical protein